MAKKMICERFKSLTQMEQQQMTKALQANAQGQPLLQKKNDTSLVIGDLHSDQVIVAVRSVPCHY